MAQQPALKASPHLLTLHRIFFTSYPAAQKVSQQMADLVMCKHTLFQTHTHIRVQRARDDIREAVLNSLLAADRSQFPYSVA